MDAWRRVTDVDEKVCMKKMDLAEREMSLKVKSLFLRFWLFLCLSVSLLFFEGFSTLQRENNN